MSDHAPAAAVERLAYSPSEMAVALGVSRNTIHNWITAGQLRTVKLGRRRLIPASEWDRLVAEGGT
jgi:excisionase family DNA binding protein